MLGRVGVTGITTTPHLHFQIDTAEAPFHPYWPFSMGEARKNGMSIFQAVTAGLGRDNASRYTINPLAFVQHSLSGNTSHFIHEIPKNTLTRSLEEVVQFNAANSVPETAAEPIERGLEEIVQFRPEEKSPVYVASHIVHNTACKNLPGLDVNTAFGMIAATLHDESCLLDEMPAIGAEQSVTRGQALIALMKFYKETPLSGTSHFLDIPLSDTTLQGYALRAYQKGIFRGQTITPNRVITKGEFIEVLSRFGKLQSAPAGHTAITDIDKNSTLAQSIQNYGYTIGAKDMKLSPNAPLTQGEMVMLLKKLQK